MKVSFYANMRQIVGDKTVEVPVPEGTTVRQLLDEVVGCYPPLREIILNEKDEVSRSVHVFVNGRGMLQLQDGLATVLSHDDAVDIIPAVAGG
jgi:molybdopterin synthase sulfur carrier subunit